MLAYFYCFAFVCVVCFFVFYYFLFIYCYMREDIRNIYSLNAIHRSSVEDQNDEAAGNNLVSS